MSHIYYYSKVVVSNVELFMVVEWLILQEDDNRIWTLGPDKGRLWSRVELDAFYAGTAVSPLQ